MPGKFPRGKWRYNGLVFTVRFVDRAPTQVMNVEHMKSPVEKPWATREHMKGKQLGKNGGTVGFNPERADEHEVMNVGEFSGKLRW